MGEGARFLAGRLLSRPSPSLSLSRTLSRALGARASASAPTRGRHAAIARDAVRRALGAVRARAPSLPAGAVRTVAAAPVSRRSAERTLPARSRADASARGAGEL